ncbi:MAG: DUF1653 domain-containing protein, partial [Candidatus Paceibacterota bacterium]
IKYKLTSKFMAHTDSAQLLDKLNSEQYNIEIGAKYYHYKNPQTHYQVLQVALLESDEEQVVIYQSIDDSIIWVRKINGENGWNTPVQIDNGQVVNRFERVEG